MPPLTFRPASEHRDAVDAEVARQVRLLAELLPGTEIEEMGATAVPGALTKGDLDLLVRVSAEEFVAAVETLQAPYEIHQPENWTETYASFKQVGAEMPVGLQLVVAGSDLDCAFVELRALLRKSSDLLERLNELKRSFEGGDPDAYVEAKGALIEDLLQRPAR